MKFILLSLVLSIAIQGQRLARPGVRNAIWEVLQRDTLQNPISDRYLAPLFIRLAWHMSGTFDAGHNLYGCRGATIRFPPESEYEDNRGLDVARRALEQVKDAHPDITYADLYTLAGIVGVQYLGGPIIPWRPGRSDALNGSSSPPDGLLPAPHVNADVGPNHTETFQAMNSTFSRMGFTQREMIALIGAHAVGELHLDRSGYRGPWTRSPDRWTNDFYATLLFSRWTPLVTLAGKTQYIDQGGVFSMLPSDIALLHDSDAKQVVEEYALNRVSFNRDFSDAFSKLLEQGVEFLEELEPEPETEPPVSSQPVEIPEITTTSPPTSVNPDPDVEVEIDQDRGDTTQQSSTSSIKFGSIHGFLAVVFLATLH